VRVEDGNLVISALCPAAPCGIRDGSITSGKINTLGKFNFRFGKIVARIKPPTGKAAWPAFWSLGTNFPDVGWPRSGEIDFMEVHNFFSDENTTHFTMHWWDENADSWVFDSQFLTTGENLGDDFHIFEADWNEDRIIGKIDGQTYFTRQIEPDTMEEFLEEFYMILNVAMGGTLGSGNEPPAGDETFPQTMLVDYVRVFQGSEGSGGGAGALLANFDDVIPPINEFGGAAPAIEAGPEGGDGNALKITRDGGEVFAGVFLEVSGIPTAGGEQTISALVYSPTAGIPFVTKLEYDENVGTGDVQANEALVVGWQTLTWTYNLEAGNDYNRFVILPDLGTVGAGEEYYIDNITLVGDDGGDGGGDGGTGGGDAPTVAAPTPPARDAADVVSLFSDAYTDVTVDTWKTDWSIAVLADVDIAGNATKEYTNLNFVGIETVAEQVDATGMTHFHVDIWTPNAESLEIKLVDFGPNGAFDGPGAGDDTEGSIFLNADSTPPAQGEWISLDIPLADFEAAGLTTRANIAQLIFAATPSDNVTLYVDNVYFYTGTGGGSGSASTDFEGGSYTFSDFGGATAAVIANPDASGINVSTQVAQMQKFAGEVFAGSTLDLGGAVDLAAADSYTMKVRAQRPVVVTFKLETGAQETTANHSGSGTWEQLCFDFTGVAATVTGITIIFDNGTAGDAANFPDDWTFQFDDIEQIAGSCPATGPTFAPITFDDPAVTYTLTGFGGNTAVVTNDPVGGTNMVMQADKSDTAELWAGTTISTEANDAVPTIPLDASNTTMTVRVYSPDAGIPVRLKIEDAADPTISVETEATTTVVNTWETLTFDFSNQAADTAAFNEANTYNKISIFFNFGTTGADAGAKTYYADDIEVGSNTGGGTGITLPVTFDVAALDYELTDFGGVATTLIADPLNAANTVASSNKPLGAELWGGTTVANATGFGALPFTATDTSMTVRVYSPDAGIPVRLKVEDITNPAISVETEATTTVANAWETLTFDFSTPAADTAALNLANTYDKASVFFNFGTDGNTAGDKTYLWDDLTFVTGGGGGGGGGDTVLATFDEATPPAVTAFGGAVAVIEPGPAGGDGSNTLNITRDGGEVFAGAWIAIQPIPSDTGTQTVSVQVYSPTAGIPMIAKAEYGDNVGTGDVPANEAVVVGWQTLTWTFTNLNPAEVYNRFVLLPNLGTVDTATSYFFDNVTLLESVGGGGGGGGGTGSANFVNGDFETGDFTGWVQTLIPDAVGSIAIDNSGQGGRTGSVARLITDASATQTNDVLISQVALAAGTITPGDSINVSFDLYGSLAGAGGVVFVEVIFLDATGQDVGGRDFVGPAAPYVPTTTWTNHSGTVIAGTATGGGTFDVSGGVWRRRFV
jgi:hypothetical protein